MRSSLRNGYGVLLFRPTGSDSRGMNGYMNIGKEHMAWTFLGLLGFLESAQPNPVVPWSSGSSGFKRVVSRYPRVASILSNTAMV